MAGQAVGRKWQLTRNAKVLLAGMALAVVAWVVIAGRSDSGGTDPDPKGSHACIAVLDWQDDYLAGRTEGNDELIARFHVIARGAQQSSDPYVRTSMRRMDEAASTGTQADLESAFAAVKSACDLP